MNKLSQHPIQDNDTCRPSRGPLVLAYTIYIPLAAVLIALCRHHLNVDGVSYLRIAKYYANLDFDLAVTGYWAPLFSWLLIPWQLVGADAVWGGNIVSAFAGALFIAATGHLGRLFGLRGLIAWVIPLSAGLLSLTWLERGIFPDVLLAALLTLYFARSYAMSRSLKVWDAAQAGALAGLCYLAKHYALPFFVLHHTLTSLMVSRRTTGWRPKLPHLKCWLGGAVACLLLAGPWLIVLSIKYDRPTFATTGKIAHSLAGPEVPPGDYWPLFHLITPRPGRITTWENPDEIPIPWPQWSPLGSISGLTHQLRLFYRNGREIAQRLFAADGLGLLYCVLLAAPLIACLPRGNLLGLDPWPWRWSLVAIGSYLSGFMLVFAGTRRYYWPLQGLLLALFGIAALEASSILARGRLAVSRWASAELWQVGFAGIIIWAAALPGVETVRDTFNRPDLYRVAMKLRDLGVKGPIATNHWHNAIEISYYLDTPCVGVPLIRQPEQIKEQLGSLGVKSFLLFEGESRPSGAAALNNVAEYLGPLLHVIDEGNVRVRIYCVDGEDPED